jgi:hypothetical protein
MSKKTLKPAPVVLPYAFPTKQRQPYHFKSWSEHGDICIAVTIDRWKSSIVIEFDDYGHGRVDELAKKFIAEIEQYTRIPIEMKLRHIKKPSKRPMEIRATSHSICIYDAPIPYARTVADVIVPLVQTLWSDLQAREGAYRALGMPLPA